MSKVKGQAGVAAGILAVVVAVVAVANIANFQLSGQQIAKDSLAAFYSFDDISGSQVPDSSGNNNAGTLSGATVDRGKIGKALNFAGGKVSIPASSSLNIQGPMSFSLWFKGDVSGTNFNRLIQKGQGPGQAGYGCAWSGGSTGKLDCWYTTSSGTEYVKGIPKPSTADWHHLAVVYDGQAGIKIFLDGADAATTSGSSGYGASGTELAIGNRAGASTQPFNGLIDQVRVYSRALLAAEVGQLLTESTPTPTPSTTTTSTTSPSTSPSTSTSSQASPLASTTFSSTPVLSSPGIIEATPTIKPTPSIQPSAQKFTITATTPADYKYKIYATQGSDNSWAKIVVKHPDGTEAGSATINKGGSYDFKTLGFSVTVVKVSATEDNAINSVQIKLTSLLPSITLPTASPIETENEKSCSAAGGTWTAFPSSCKDSCRLLTGSPVLCAASLTNGCDCGPEKCWDGTKCAANPTPSQTPTPSPSPSTSPSPSPSPSTSPSTTTSPTPVSLPGLIARWKLDDTSGLIAADSSGKANNGNLNSNPQWGIAGKFGTAMKLTGSQYFSPANPQLIDFDKPATFSFWAKSGSTGTVFGKEDTTWNDIEGYKGWYIQLQASSLKVLAQSSTGTDQTILTFPINPQTGWNHYALVIDPSTNSAFKQSKLYLNGNPINPTAKDIYGSGSQGNIKTSLPLLIGAIGDSNTGTTGSYFSGELDEIQIYSRVLSADEAKQLCGSTCPSSGSPVSGAIIGISGKQIAAETVPETVTITPDTPAEYSYKIYAPKGVDNVKAAIDIKEPKGNLVESTSITRDETRAFENLGFSARVTAVRATQDGRVGGVDIELTPLLGLPSSPSPTPTVSPTPTPVLESQISTIPVDKPIEFGVYKIHLAKPSVYQQYVEIYAEDKKGVRVAGQIFYGSTGSTYSFVNKAGFILELLETNKFLGFGDLESVKVKITPVPKGTKYGKIGEARGYPSNPLDFGTYKIYSDKGSMGKWASIYLKDAQGIVVVKPTQANKDEETQLEVDGFKFKIKVLKVIANDDGTLSGPSAVELLVTPVDKPPLLPIPTAKNPRARVQASTALVTGKQPYYFAGYKLSVGGPGVSRGGVGSGYVDLGLEYPDGRHASIVVKEGEPNYDFLYEGFILNALSVTASERGPSIPVIDTSAYVYISPYPSKTKFLTLIPGEETAFGDYKVYSEVVDPLTAKITFRDKEGKDLLTQAAPIGEIRYWTGYIAGGQDIAIDPGYIAKVEDIRIDPNTGKPVGIEIAFIPARGNVVKPETASGTLAKGKFVTIGNYKLSLELINARNKEAYITVNDAADGSYLGAFWVNEGKISDFQDLGLKVTAKKLELKADIEVFTGLSLITPGNPATFRDYKIYWNGYTPDLSGFYVYIIDKNGKQSDPKLLKKGSVSYDFSSAGFAIELLGLNTNQAAALVKITALSSPTDTSITTTTPVPGTLGMDNFIHSGPYKNADYKIYAGYVSDNYAQIILKNEKGETVAESYVYKGESHLFDKQEISVKLKDVEASADIVAETYIPATPTPPPKASPTPLPPDSEYAKIGPTGIYGIPRINSKVGIYTENYQAGKSAIIIVKDMETGQKLTEYRINEGSDFIFFQKGYKFSVKVVYVPQSSDSGLQVQTGQGIVDVLVTILERPIEESGAPSPGVYADICETDLYTFHPGDYKIYSSPYSYKVKVDNEWKDKVYDSAVWINIDNDKGRRVERKLLYVNQYVDFPTGGFRVTLLEIKKEGKGCAKVLVSPITKVEAPPIYIQPQQCSLLIENGKPIDKLDLVVVGDGDWEDEEFEKAVRKAINYEGDKKQGDGILYAEPLKSLKKKFNIWGYNTRTTFLNPNERGTGTTVVHVIELGIRGKADILNELIKNTDNIRNTIKWVRNCPVADAVLVLTKQTLGVAGYAYRGGGIGRNFGFVSVPRSGDAIGHVAAHELGHSLFNMEHDATQPNTMGYYSYGAYGNNWLPYQASQIEATLAFFKGDGGMKADNAGRRVADQSDDFSGKQIHLMYVLPSDGADESLDTNGKIATSVAAFQKWLAGQAGGRKLKIDTYQNSPDITFFRLSKTDAEVRSKNEHVRELIESELKAAGFNDPNKIYAVYYGGSSSYSCGGGSWPPTLTGNVAAVYLKGTPPNSPACATNALAGPSEEPKYWEFSMLHEILHTMGFVATCAPHQTLTGHVSEDPQDLMYGGNLNWYPSKLDIGHDDYYGHSNPNCLDLAKSDYLGA